MRDVGVGEVGEVVHRSPQVTAGYYNDDERTAAAFAGGWFNSGGENVSSREVEEVLYRHPAVAEVAVVGVPDDRWIEAVCAVVVVRDGASVGADELPKNPSGKILKRELRATASS
jgi:fatty-acyl-CoA synthase